MLYFIREDRIDFHGLVNRNPSTVKHLSSFGLIANCQMQIVVLTQFQSWTGTVSLTTKPPLLTWKRQQALNPAWLEIWVPGGSHRNWSVQNSKIGLKWPQTCASATVRHADIERTFALINFLPSRTKVPGCLGAKLKNKVRVNCIKHVHRSRYFEVDTPEDA